MGLLPPMLEACLAVFETVNDVADIEVLWPLSGALIIR